MKPNLPAPQLPDPPTLQLLDLLAPQLPDDLTQDLPPQPMGTNINVPPLLDALMLPDAPLLLLK
jgi:hypothetical protein